MTSTTPSAWPEHLCVVAPPAGVEPAITFDEAAAAASLENVSALEAACAQISAVVGSGGVALVFNCAAPLCCAYLVASGRATLAESISLVAARLGAHAAPATPTLLQLSPPPQQRFRWLGREALQALLRLEMRVRGEASDLSTVPGFPLHWLWVHMTDGGDRTTLVARGRVIEVLRLRPDPRMALVRGFLSSAEARHIVELARASLHPSRVVNHEAGGTAVVSDARTSYSCKVASAADVVVQRAVQRAAYLSGLSPQHAEAVQLVHYLPGQEYRPHFDWFAHRDARFGEKTAVTGNRLVSFFVYLSGCEAGGHTGFPRLGQSFAPEEGTGVVWYNLDRNGTWRRWLRRSARPHLSCLTPPSPTRRLRPSGQARRTSARCTQAAPSSAARSGG